jgi:mannose-6-phosphate isomerase-like protein (cupin superfamily)
MEQQTNKSPSVIPRSDIPVTPSGDDGSLEVRPFMANKILSSLMPAASAVSMSWTQARSGKDVPLRSHPTPGLLIILEGRAVLIGGLNRKVEAGDVVTLPANHQYGFSAVGPAGLNAIHVSFDGDPLSYTDEALTLQQLLARNEARLQTTLNNSFFSLLRRRGIDSERKRTAMREALRVFSDAFQTLLFTRQATCRDDEYASEFNQHLLEELGHNNLLKVSGMTAVSKDAVLRAMSSWFCHQMLVLDNAEKAVVNLVLESGGYYLGTLSMPMFEGDSAQNYFDTHAEDDAHHKELSVGLLEGLHPHTYVRLQRVLDSSWDMVDAMTQRFAELIELDAGSS